MGMQTLDIDRVHPGMRLAADVRTDSGTVLFLSGTVITEPMLKDCRTGGIDRLVVDVNLETVQTTADRKGIYEAPLDVLDMAATAVNDHFSCLEKNDPVISALFDLAVERRCNSLMQPDRKPSFVKQLPALSSLPKPAPAHMKTLLDSDIKMGTLPVIFHRLIEIINNPRASAADAAKIIAADPALCAKLLRLVNSPLYGLVSRIDTIPRAVIMVGTGQLVMLAMGTTLLTAFKGIPGSLINMQEFWNHSMACGVAARLLARNAGVGRSEVFFVAGLLHDIARLLIYTQLPNHAVYVMTRAAHDKVPVHSLEKQVYGFTHEEFGGELLRSWNCPPELIQRVEGHHEAAAVQSPDAAVLPAADLIANVLDFGCSGELYPPFPANFPWHLLCIFSSELSELVRNITAATEEMRSAVMVSHS